MRSQHVVMCAALVAALAAAPLARAATSQNVVIIGGSTLDTSTSCSSYAAANVMGWTSGGCLWLASAPFTSYAFTAMAPAAVSAASLAPFDTAVLNLASYAMQCSSATLSAQAQADLVAFVAGGKKLIVYDSECSPGPTYAWLPFPFSTNNPGAMGAAGTLNILENSTLGSSAAGPYYVDAAYMGGTIDAVGDMNVMTSQDSHWCVALSGTNYNQVTGAVHTYATYPAGTDTGLFIYNGLDQDYQGYEGRYNYGNGAGLIKIWSLELAQAFNPSTLPCVVVVTGIKLTPDGVTRPVGGTHTVTATLSDLLANPRPGILVSFAVAGANAGAAGTCVPASCVSDAAGTVAFTYTGAVAGADTITGSFTDGSGTHQASVGVTWQQQQVDVTPPSCALTGMGVDGSGARYISVTVADAGSGLATVIGGLLTNATLTVPAFTVGTTSPVVVTATKVNQAQGSVIQLVVTDVAGNRVVCDPQVAGDAGAPQTGCGGPAGVLALLGVAAGALLRRRR